jgi:hypothetical protein
MGSPAPHYLEEARDGTAAGDERGGSQRSQSVAAQVDFESKFESRFTIL